jgi:hypothetical protein
MPFNDRKHMYHYVQSPPPKPPKDRWTWWEKLALLVILIAVIIFAMAVWLYLSGQLGTYNDLNAGVYAIVGSQSCGFEWRGVVGFFCNPSGW